MLPLIGQVQLFAFEFAPTGWMVCDGALLSVTNYQVLFATIGTTYGGDGRTTFALPNIPPVIPKGPAYYIAFTGQLAKH